MQVVCAGVGLVGARPLEIWKDGGRFFFIRRRVMNEYIMLIEIIYLIIFIQHDDNVGLPKSKATGVRSKK